MTNPIKTRVLGSSGLTVSAIGLGCMGMSDFYGKSDDDQSLAVLEKALELGVNFFDTADMYGTGMNEYLLSRFLKNHRDQVVIATKFGNVRRLDGAMIGLSGKPDYVKSACDMSLKRLNVDVIDLYYQHRVDPETPIEDTVGAMADLVNAGKVRFLGLSEAGPQTIRRAQAVHPIAALQTEYSLWSREPENELLTLCRELNIAFVAYSPLGRGFLTGQIKSTDELAANDFRRFMPRMQGENLDKNLERVAQLEAMATEKGCTSAQLALAWVLAQAEHIIPIPGTRREKYLRENVAAIEMTLTAADLARLDAILPAESAAGTRYTPEMMKRLSL
jgi:aryl-alcohol dehydrogenase-like predicted oxidoreductase